MQDKPITFRHAHKEDVPFIFSSWLKSYRHSLHVKNIANTVYFGEHHKLLEKIMRRSEAVIACNPENANDIYGYLVYERITGVLVVHYAYVKQMFRRFGICKAMMKEAGHDRTMPSAYTHETFIGNKISSRFNAFYNPYVVYLGYEQTTEESTDGVKNEN